MPSILATGGSQDPVARTSCSQGMLPLSVRTASKLEHDKAEALNHQLVKRALAMDGTCTGEHGVGLHKMGFLVEEAGAGAVQMMRSIKHALDPDNIMNPGKIFTW